MLALCAICRNATCSHVELEFAGLVSIPTVACPATTLPARSEPHTPLRDRAGLSSAHNQSHAAEVR